MRNYLKQALIYLIFCLKTITNLFCNVNNRIKKIKHKNKAYIKKKKIA